MYKKQVWHDGDSSTPLNGERLTHIESGIADAHDLIANIPTTPQPADVSVLVPVVHQEVEKQLAERPANPTDTKVIESLVTSKVSDAIGALPHSLSEDEVRKIASQIARDEIKKLPGDKSVSALDYFNPSHRYFSPVTYFYADHWKPDSLWKDAVSNPDVTSIVILNPNSGPDSEKKTDFEVVRAWAKNDRIKAIGYVLTKKGTRPHDEILSDLRKHVEWYGVDGVFLDEMVNGWSTEEQAKVPLYKELYKKIRTEFGDNFLIVGNPGTNTTADMLQCADVLMSFEKTADEYLSAEENLVPEHYKTEPSTRFIHVIHNVSGEDQARKVLEKAAKSNVAHIYLTEDTFDKANPVFPNDNPWDRMPASWLLKLQTDWCRHTMLPKSVYSYQVGA